MTERNQKSGINNRLRIGIDIDGVLRNFGGSVKRNIATNFPEYKDQFQPIKAWDPTQWIPFWSMERSMSYIFDEEYEDIFLNAEPFRNAEKEWIDLKTWAESNGHKLLAISAQTEPCIPITNMWLGKYGFDFREIHYTDEKWKVNCNILVDDYPVNLDTFSKYTGEVICVKHLYNEEAQRKYKTIDSISEIPTAVNDMLSSSDVNFS